MDLGTIQDGSTNMVVLAYRHIDKVETIFQLGPPFVLLKNDLDKDQNNAHRLVLLQIQLRYADFFIRNFDIWVARPFF